MTANNTVFADSIIIDACAITAHEWHERMELSGATALQIAITWPHDDTAQALGRIQKQLGVIRADDRFTHVQSVQDIERCKAEGRVGQILSTQASDLIGRDASLVEVQRVAATARPRPGRCGRGERWPGCRSTAWQAIND